MGTQLNELINDFIDDYRVCNVDDNGEVITEGIYLMKKEYTKLTELIRSCVEAECPNERSGLHLADVTVRFIDFLPPSMIKNEKENGALYVGLIADAPKKYRHLLINSENNRYCVLNAR